jgi:tripartite-type tricarboxylate transporter receptor subunit TctC
MFNTFKALSVGVSLVVSMASAAAQGFPQKPITLIVPVAAGGTTDIAGRILANQLKDVLGQMVIVENKAGASGGIGNTYVARANPDGYTLVLAYEGFNTGNPALTKNLPWDPVKSFTPIAEVIRGPHLVLVPKDSPIKDLKGLVEFARANPGKLNYGSSGVGSIQHLGAELLQLKTNTKMVHVPYGGAAPAMKDLLAGRIDLFITTPPTAMGHLKAGTLRALAITSEKRHPMLPDVPTTAEAGLPEFQLDAWFTVFGPANMPEPVVKKLTEAMKTVITSPQFVKQMNEQGATASYRSPKEIADIVNVDLKKWADVVKASGIKAE